MKIQWRRLILPLLLCFFTASVSACGSAKDNDQASATSTETSAFAVSETTDTEASEADGSAVEEISPDSTGQEGIGTLVVYFSATGNTKAVAEKIASIENADLYEIVPADPYTEEDLDYNDSNSRTTIEQNDPSARPEIGSAPISLDSYSSIYIGYPIWWGDAPRIMSTFVESYDFDGRTVIPFCTSGSSGIGDSGRNLEELAGTGNWLQGERFTKNVSDNELQNWIDGLHEN
jgi:flavodoxin